MHRNVANMVVHTDLNCLSVMQFAVDVLSVKHVIVCGHYGCGGVEAALEGTRLGLIDNWLRHVHDVGDKHADELASLPEATARPALRAQRDRAGRERRQTTIVQDAGSAARRSPCTGWSTSLHDGLLRDLGVSTAPPCNAVQVAFPDDWPRRVWETGTLRAVIITRWRRR